MEWSQRVQAALLPTNWKVAREDELQAAAAIRTLPASADDITDAVAATRDLQPIQATGHMALSPASPTHNEPLMPLLSAWVRLVRGLVEEKKGAPTNLLEEHKKKMIDAGLNHSSHQTKVLRQLLVRMQDYHVRFPDQVKLNPVGRTKKTVLIHLFSFLRTVLLPLPTGVAPRVDPSRKKQLGLLKFNTWTNKWLPHIARLVTVTISVMCCVLVCVCAPLSYFLHVK